MMILFFIIMFIAIVVMIAQVSDHARSHEDTQRELAAKIADETLLSETDRMTRLAEVLIQLRRWKSRQGILRQYLLALEELALMPFEQLRSSFTLT